MKEEIMLSLALVMLFAANVSGEAEQVGSFRIVSPRQSARSVLLAWETDKPVRTLQTRVRWSPSAPTGASHICSVVSGEGRDGSAAAKIVGKTSASHARGCFLLNLPDVRKTGRYEYSLWYRTAARKKRKAGHARLVIDCYTGKDRKYRGLVNRDLPASADWREATGGFELPGETRLTRVLLYQMGQGTVWFDDVRLNRAESPKNLIPDSAFEGRPTWRVFFRRKGNRDWRQVEAVVWERFHNVIFLTPKTTYEFKVEQISPAGEVLSRSQVLTAATTSWQDWEWEGLRFGSEQRAPAPPAIYPCVESVAGRLYLVESRGADAIWLTELDDNFESRWTKQWIKPFRAGGRWHYQGQCQTAALGERLYVSWKRAHDGDAPHARQCVASYDVQTGEIGTPFVIEPPRTDESTWNGGIAALHGTLWVSYCRWRRISNGYRTTITVRQLDYEQRRLGPAFELSPQPTDTPYTPFLSVFNDELVVCFTESQSHTDKQPLWLVRFDGHRFHGLLTVSPTGFNQYAKGVQFRDNLLLLWKYGAPYPASVYGRYMFHDIGIALVDPSSGSVKRTSLVSDFKYNSSPDVTWHKGRLIYAYNKFEHLYGNPADPAKLYGCFLGTITPESVRLQTGKE